MRKMKKCYHLIGILILLVIFSRVDFQRILTNFSRVNILRLVLINLLILPAIFIKAMRWFYLLRLQGIDYSIRDSVISYMGGIYAGIVTPGRAGEAIKAVYLKADKGISFAEGMASVVIDRLFDLYLLFLLGAVGILSFLTIKGYGYSVLFLFLAVLVIIVPFVLFNKSILEKAARIIYEAFVSKIDKSIFENQFKNFLSAVKKITGKRIYPAFILTVLSHFFYFSQCYLLARIMSINITFVMVISFLSIATLVSILPITMWGFGTREATLIYCFSSIGLGAESAIAYSFLLFTSFYIISGLISFVGWALKGYYGLNIHKK